MRSGWLGIAMLVASASRAAAAASPSAGGAPDDAERPGWTTDDAGRVFRTHFDPGRRALAGLGWAPRVSSSEATAEPLLLETGIFDRQLVDFALARVSWKLSHEALVATARLDSPLDQRLDATLYRGRFMRWSRDGSISLPSSPGDALPFPLNIGVDAEVGRLDVARSSSAALLPPLPGRADATEARPAQRPAVAAELGVARTAVMLDFWRQRALGSHAALGLGPSYELWLWGKPEGRIEHWISPFTTGALDVHHEWDDARQSFELRATGGWALSTDGGGSARARARASYELVVLAVDDLPLSATASVAYRFEQAPHPTGSAHELRAAISLRVGIPLAGW